MKFTILALFLVYFILIDAVKAINYKRKYCKKRNVIGNIKDGASLECNKDWIDFSFEDEYSGGIIRFAKDDDDKCDRFYHILKYPQYYGAFYRSKKVTDSLQKFGVRECGSGEYSLFKLLKEIKELQQENE